ncbi:MAG: hypothetical protein D3916_18330, partial [Candidatus Electrothrix sp. MAN1_4]|nr:hypothetical protein [Candidatus Electrothrix sp. MAN1_4]
DNAGKKLEKLGKKVKEFFQLVPSGKHMSGRDLGRLEPTPSLSLDIRYKKGVEKYPCIEQFQLPNMPNKHFFRSSVLLPPDVEHFPSGI